MRKLSKAKVGAAAVGAAALTFGLVSPALADIAPGANDITGGGSDTVQYISDFLWGGNPSGLGANYNAGKTNRVFSFDATGDANGRATYLANSATTLASTIVLRNGTSPVIRPNGSGAGIAALYSTPYISSPASATDPVLNFARSSRLPKCTEDATAAAHGLGGLHLFRAATENLAIATIKSGSNAPASLSASDLVNIYQGDWQTWSDIGGPVPGPHNGTKIIPEIPQSGSGTRNTFLADLQAANGGTAITLGNPNLITVEENDFSSLTSPGGVAANAPNAIAPFSGSRITLNDNGYFGASAANKVVQIGGYVDNRGLYFIVPENQVTAAGAFQPGGTRNWVNTLFGGNGVTGSSTVIGGGAYAADITYAGGTASYADLGRANVSGAGGNCT
jgi:ABC-type phosphate transport system substrate-binding protein